MINYHDYLIVLTLPENIVNHIRGFKNAGAKIIGEYDGLNAKAHITVQHWPRKKPVWIEPLLPKLERDLQALPPLVLETSGFAFFEQQDRKTIYAKINATPLTKIWFKHLRKFFSTPPFDPYITIARNITEEDFKKLWPFFKTHEFDEQFKVDKLNVLRRETIGYNKSFKVFKQVEFNQKLDFYKFTTSKLNMPVLPVTKTETRQASLF